MRAGPNKLSLNTPISKTELTLLFLIIRFQKLINKLLVINEQINY